jgi:hypothetical protein
MSNSEKFNAETSLRMLKEATKRMEEFLKTGDKTKVDDAEWFARNAHKSAQAVKAVKAA